MVILYPHTNILTIPRIDRCKENPCKVYQLILQKKSDNKIIVFKLRDWTIGRSLRYHFNFSIPCEMAFGEYNLYLTQASEWGSDEVNDLYPAETFRQTDKSALIVGGKYIISNGRVLVTSAHKKILVDNSGIVSDKTHDIFLVTEFSDDIRDKGELYEDLKVLYRGLLRYIPDEFTDIQTYSEPDRQQRNTYTEYNG